MEYCKLETPYKHFQNGWLDRFVFHSTKYYSVV